MSFVTSLLATLNKMVGLDKKRYEYSRKIFEIYRKRKKRLKFKKTKRDQCRSVNNH